MEEREKDDLDLEVERLTLASKSDPAAILRSWAAPPGPLFDTVYPGGYDKSCGVAGCLTQICGLGGMYACDGLGNIDMELTNEIRSDSRLPRNRFIEVEHLPVFAEWQRKIRKRHAEDRRRAAEGAAS